MTTAISSSIYDGKRFLQIIYTSPSIPELSPFAWEDWKQQLVFAALLSGGFTDDEEIYRVFSTMDVAGAKMEPNGEVRSGTEMYEWDARLHAGYCRVRYFMSNTIADITHPDTKIPRMSISIYESEAHYKKMQQEAIKPKEALENTSAEISN